MSSAALKEAGSIYTPVINMCLYKYNNRPTNLKNVINELLQHSTSEKHSKFKVFVWTSSDRSVREEMEKRSAQRRMPPRLRAAPLFKRHALYPPTISPMRYMCSNETERKERTSSSFSWNRNSYYKRTLSQASTVICDSFLLIMANSPTHQLITLQKCISHWLKSNHLLANS